MSGHNGAMNAFTLEGLDEPGELAEGEPVNGCGAAFFDFRRGLFLDGGYHDVESLGASGVNDQEGKLAVAGDEAEFFFGGHGAGKV